MKPFPFLLFTLLPVALTALARSADQADATDSRSFTLASVSNDALRNNPSIKTALSRWTAMKARVPQAAAWDDPRVSADFNAARFVAVPPNAFMDQTVTLEQMIPISGKNRVRSRIAGAEALAAFEAVRRQQLDVITKVRTSYLRLLKNYALLDLNEKNIASLRQIADVARSRYETGTESATGVLLAETEASKLQETRRDLERRISDEKSQLNILMNRDAFDPLGIPRKEILRRMDLPLTQLRARMLAQRPEVRTAQAQIEAEREKVQLARREWIPDPAIIGPGTALQRHSTSYERIQHGHLLQHPLGKLRKIFRGNQRGPEQPRRRAGRAGPRAEGIPRAAPRSIAEDRDDASPCGTLPKRDSLAGRKGLCGKPVCLRVRQGRIFRLDHRTTPAPGHPGHGAESSHRLPNRHRRVGRNRGGGSSPNTSENSEIQIE